MALPWNDSTAFVSLGSLAIRGPGLKSE